MLKWLGRLLGRRQPNFGAREGRAVADALRLIRARYDAAATTDENRRHWANADGLSANAANSAEVRRLLRNRARYEVANNSFAKGIALTLANDVVGTGPRLQMLLPHTEANSRIERAWSQWAHAIRLPEKLRALRHSRVTDGEGFALLSRNTRLRTPVQLDLRLVEAEQVTTPPFNAPQPNAIDGIVFDEFANPVEYHVLRRHPGDSGYVNVDEYDRVPAEDVIHDYRMDRPGQLRGIPDVTPALPLFAQLRRYTLAVITAAEVAALPGGILYTDAPANGEAEPVEPMDLVELERGMLMTMPGGWRMSQVQAQFPQTTYVDFVKQILTEIARCLNMPYIVAAGDASRHNYASGRLDHQTYAVAIGVDQSHVESIVLNRLLDAWFDEAALIPGLLPEGLGPFGEWPRAWIWTSRGHVDPAKEASAQATRLASMTTTLAAEYAKQGLDWEAQLRQRAKEQQLLAELGLSPDTTPISTDDEDAEDEDEAVEEERAEERSATAA